MMIVWTGEQEANDTSPQMNDGISPDDGVRRCGLPSTRLQAFKAYRSIPERRPSAC